MRNRFGASCYRCGKYCEAGEGHFEAIKIPREGKKRWRVQHAEPCARIYAGTDHQYDKPETWNRQMELPLCDDTGGLDNVSSASVGKSDMIRSAQQSTKST